MVDRRRRTLTASARGVIAAGLLTCAAAVPAAAEPGDPPPDVPIGAPVDVAASAEAPPPISALAPDGTQGIVTTMAPGAETMHDLRVRNNTADRVLTIAVQAVMARVEPDGTFTLDPAPSGAALWLHPQVSDLRLAPGEEQTVPVQVLVPPDATSSGSAAVALTVGAAVDLRGAVVNDAVGQAVYVGFVVQVDPAVTTTTAAVPTSVTAAAGERGPSGARHRDDDRLAGHWLWYAAAVALILTGFGVRRAARPR